MPIEGKHRLRLEDQIFAGDLVSDREKAANFKKRLNSAVEIYTHSLALRKNQK
jgi:hypothetical protein